MSAKWIRSQRWDDRHLTGLLAPVKVVLRLFSWISTSVTLLSLVAVYGILASVPIGLLAKAPTVLFYALTFVIAVGVVAVLPVWVTTRSLNAAGVGRAARLAAGIVGVIGLSVLAAWLWWWAAWPRLRYDPEMHTGIRFFGEFVDKYQAVQFRRLPCMEMSELEFYSWWPLRAVLLLFVLNLTVATIRRIEFTFPRIGVLTVHSGIITIALGSIYYSTHKQEGDLILLASGVTDDAGRPMGARAETGFYDNRRVALWVTQDVRRGWEPRVLEGVPRYHDYNLDAVARTEPRLTGEESLPALDIRVPGSAVLWKEKPQPEQTFVDPDITFRVVGYAGYCELDEQWRPAVGMETGERLRTIEMVVVGEQGPPRRVWQLLPDDPVRRASDEGLHVEYVIGMPEDRWTALATPVRGGAGEPRPGLYFDELPDGSVRAVVRMSQGNPTVQEHLKPGDQLQLAPVIAARIGQPMEKAVRVEVPRVVPEEERDRQRVGNHEASAIAVEVREKSGASSVHWVPFSQYLDLGGPGGEPGREVHLSDGRTINIAFGRVRHDFWPPMSIRLHDFEMIPYEHSQTPRDYRSEVVVTMHWPRADGEAEAKSEVCATSLNNPLLVRTPYVAPPGMPWLGRALGRLMSVVAPNQYKFSQAGWDQQGWRQSEAAVARGEMKRPMARFTILGVGNNPGIYIIAAGAVMMSVGIPWAFYLKPLLMKREKRKIQERLAREGQSGKAGMKP